jgi:hypothetical protein
MKALLMEIAPHLAVVVFVAAVAIGAVVFGASQEARAFNRCHPGANVTTWEAVWADYRIMDCPGSHRGTP